MRRWHGCVALANACRPCTPCKTFVGLRQIRLAFSTGNSTHEGTLYQQYAVFQKTPVPESNRVEDWAALLDGALPPHLRDENVSPPLLTLAATDLAEVLLAAQTHDESTRRKGHDLLFYLGFQQGRWSAVVWLIKKLVDRFPIPRQPDASITDSLALWKQAPPFYTPLTTIPEDTREQSITRYIDETGYAGRMVTEYPIQLELDLTQPGPTSIKVKSLDELTDSLGDGLSFSQQSLAHDALGQIWRTLGAMTQACAGGSIRQEVLEIIAYLHHREIMPVSIYQYRPTLDKSAIQQPPLIPLLSSRILTSLSDAAWRAHEKLLAEEAKVRQGDASKTSPILAAPYRARIDGLFPEVWLELILWSCLHGGWIKQGGHILHSISSHSGWKPLSWREYEKALPQHGQLDSNEWDAWDYIFKTRGAKSMDPPDSPIPEVQRTVSAEVVNAYIDAIVSLPPDTRASSAPKFNHRGKLMQLKLFLSKGNLGLTTGSWDALVIRLLESNIEALSPETISRIVSLSPGLGQGLTAKNTQDLPAYVLDGGLAMQGILNRVLHGRVLAGDMEPALRVLKDMMARTDRDKQTSLVSFLEGSKPLLRALDGSDMFTSNVTGIEYPAFDVQIPTLTLALFLDMVTQAKAYEFGRWLLYSKDADGPVIRRDLYDDPFLTPALVRFAAATQDAKLFSLLRDLPNFAIHFVLDAQIDAMRWEAATGIVQYNNESKTRRRPWHTWTFSHLANLARVMLLQVPGAVAGQAESRKNLLGAMRLFSMMVEQVENTDRSSKVNFAFPVQTLLDALSSLDASWAKFCSNLRRLNGHHDMMLRPGQFNSLLEGVVTAYGSVAGIKLLTLFWPLSARRSLQRTPSPAADQRDPVERQRIVIQLPGMSPEHKAVLYGALVPNIGTITIILRKALEELQNPSQSEGSMSQASGSLNEVDTELEHGDERVDMNPRGMVTWAAKRMAELHDFSGHRDVIVNINRILQDLDMNELRKDLAGIVRSSGPDLRDDSTDETDVADTGEDDKSLDTTANLEGIEADARRSSAQ